MFQVCVCAAGGDIARQVYVVNLPAFHCCWHGRKQGLLTDGSIAVCQNHAPLDDVFQLPNVAWPMIVQAKLEGFVRQAKRALVVFGVELFEEVLRQQRQVLQPLAQGWNSYRENVQPIEQICPEPTLFYRDRKSTRLNSSHVRISYA